jgi:hypothetical protein
VSRNQHTAAQEIQMIIAASSLAHAKPAPDNLRFTSGIEHPVRHLEGYPARASPAINGSLRQKGKVGAIADVRERNVVFT